MKYNKKKRITVIILSAVAACLASGLFWHMGTLENQPPVAQAESQPETEPEVTVPVIKPKNTKEPGTVAPETLSEVETTPVPEPSAAQETTSRMEGNSAAAPVIDDVKVKTSVGKPKTPDEAIPPAEPPKEENAGAAPLENPDAAGQCQPEHVPEAEQPQGGETNPDGAVYVPGFGYVEKSGPSVQRDSYTDGDWNKQIGTMQ